MTGADGRAVDCATALKTGVARTWQGLRWYLRECSGEARWDDYVRDCAQHGHAPVSRREFERRRSVAAEQAPISRCC